jgi:hypothetical protein
LCTCRVSTAVDSCKQSFPLAPLPRIASCGFCQSIRSSAFPRFWLNTIMLLPYRYSSSLGRPDNLQGRNIEINTDGIKFGMVQRLQPHNCLSALPSSPATADKRDEFAAVPLLRGCARQRKWPATHSRVKVRKVAKQNAFLSRSSSREKSFPASKKRRNGDSNLTVAPECSALFRFRKTCELQLLSQRRQPGRKARVER